jgi:hypothetical protein
MEDHFSYCKMGTRNINKKNMKRKYLEINEFSFLLSILFFFFFIYFYTISIFQYQIGGYDLSPLIDVSYRLSKNEIPYIDFINTFPLAMIAWLKLFSLIIPVNWNFLLITSLFHYYFVSIFVLIIYFFTFNFQYKKLFFCLIIFSITIPIFVTNHIWHSVFTQLNAVVVILSLSFIFIEKKPSKILFLVFFIFYGLLFFSKQNLGLLLCLSFVPIFFYHNNFNFDFKLLIFFAILPISVLFYYYFFILLFNTSFSYNEIIESYLGVSGRAIPQIFQLKDVFFFNKLNLVLSLFFFGISFFLFSKKLTDFKNSFFILQFIIQIIAFYAFLTDWDTKFNNLSVLLVSNLLYVLFILRIEFNYLKILSFFIFILVLFSMYLGMSRYRMDSVGYGVFYEDIELEKVNFGFLKGLNVSPKLISIINDIEPILSSNDNLFFGPRMEWAYAQFNLTSPSNFPLWWHPGSSFPFDDSVVITSNFKNKNFDKLIFLKDDRTRVPQEILNYINDKTLFIKEETEFLDIYSPLKP